MSGQTFHTTRPFMLGQDQAIRIPDAFRLEDTELAINRVGDSLIITPVKALQDNFYSGLAMLPEDFLADEYPEAMGEK